MNEISNINDKLWNLAEQRTTVIRPLAKQRRCSKVAILKAAQDLKLSVGYIYRLIRQYRSSHGLLTSLVPKKSDGGKGKSRLSKPQRILIDEVIEELYLTPQKLRPAYITEEVRKRCAERNIASPSDATIRRRLRKIPHAQLKIRGEDTIQTQPIIGEFPEVKYPLSVVQIDHTPVDIILVDPIERLAIGRPYLTIAIDVYSRGVPGFVLSLEAPSAVSVGLCLTHMAMEKAPWLASNNIDALWPMHGKPQKIYVDNGSDFHSAALTRGCAQHGIQLEYRPPGQPHYGGIVERIIGTMMQLIHTLPGTTFSNIQKRGSYDSDKHACLTLSELEHWLTIAITQYYHLKLHSEIQETPLKRYENGVALMKSNGETFYQVQNGKAFLIDFLPIVHRLVRRDGFMLDHIAYYANSLRPFISEREKHGKFLIRRDPRDLSRIYVYLPEDKGYLEIPYRMLSRPAISLFEHRLAIKRLHDHGKKGVDEVSLFKAIEELRSIVKTAASTTRSVRRHRNRMSENRKVQPHVSVTPTSSKLQIKDDKTTSFENIELW